MMEAITFDLLVVLLVAIAWTYQLDKNEAVRAATIRAKRGEPVMVPRCVCVPAAYRRRNR